jgi:hypothetical protein
MNNGNNGVGHIIDKGWDLEACLDKERGYTIGNVKHNDHFFAKKISIERIYIQSKRGNVESFSLGESDVNIKITPHKEVRGKSINSLPSSDPRGFYTPVLGLSTTFQTKNPVFNKDNPRMEFTQEYLFTEYSNTPSHEPSQVLKAARIYPLMRFYYPGIQDNDDPGVDFPIEIRVDYRLHVSLNLLFDEKISKISPNINVGSSKNQAGVFSDQEELHEFTGGVKSLFRQPDLIFKRAEKPLQFEVIGEGLKINNQNSPKLRKDSSQNKEPTSQMGDWDNIHQWPTKGKSGEDLPSTPGTPYASHIHWRWGKFNAIPSSLVKGGEQYKGVSGAGTALLDPEIPNESIRFAITKENRTEDINRSIINNKDNFGGFDDAIKTSKTSLPDSIANGEDLVTWISFTAIRREISFKNLNLPWKGAIFANGIFFAHESEKILPIQLSLIGARHQMFVPKHPSRQWNR